MDAMQQFNLKADDPGYQEFSAKIKEAFQERNSVNTKQCSTMRMVCNLQASLDLTRKKSWDFEATPEEVDKVLEEHTGEDGEAWFYTYHIAGEEIEKLMIQKCIKVANLAAQYDVLTERIAMLNKEQDKYGDELVKQATEKEESN